MAGTDRTRGRWRWWVVPLAGLVLVYAISYGVFRTSFTVEEDLDYLVPHTVVVVEAIDRPWLARLVDCFRPALWCDERLTGLEWFVYDEDLLGSARLFKGGFPPDRIGVVVEVTAEHVRVRPDPDEDPRHWFRGQTFRFFTTDGSQSTISGWADAIAFEEGLLILQAPEFIPGMELAPGVLVSR